ncbi:MAG: hypothetical protein PVJ43_08400 [Gemmatimonadales bacterium]|jgi:hypothetical protein
MRLLSLAAFLLAVSAMDLSPEHHGYGRGSLATVDGLGIAWAQAGDLGARQAADDGCSTVARILIGFPTLEIDSTEGEVRDYRTGRTGPGCRVEMKGSAAAVEESDAPDVALREKFAELGWTEDYAYAADGSDGSAFAFRKGSALCVFQAHWDGGDDSDPTYVPEDRYEIEVDCLSSG